MDSANRSVKHVLDPVDRLSEVLFGLIMVLTFTGSLRVATIGRTELHSMLIGTLGCTVAWGIIDGALYLMDRLAERGRRLLALRAVRTAADPSAGQRAVASALPQVVASVLAPAELETMRVRLMRLPEPPAHVRLDKDDWFGAVSIALIVIVSTLPVVIPFLFMRDVAHALRISNGIAVSMMFLAGYAHGRRLGHGAWRMGIAMVLLGGALVWLTITLGG